MSDVSSAVEPWYLYMIRCHKGQLYTGISNDPERRFKEHQSNSVRCAKFLRGKQPLQKVLQVKLNDKSLALRLEYRVKALSRAEKQRLIADNGGLEPMIAAIQTEVASVNDNEANE